MCLESGRFVFNDGCRAHHVKICVRKGLFIQVHDTHWGADSIAIEAMSVWIVHAWILFGLNLGDFFPDFLKTNFVDWFNVFQLELFSKFLKIIFFSKFLIIKLFNFFFLNFNSILLMLKSWICVKCNEIGAVYTRFMEMEPSLLNRLANEWKHVNGTVSFHKRPFRLE